MIVQALMVAVLMADGSGHTQAGGSHDLRHKRFVADVQSRIQRRPRPPRAPRRPAAPPLSAYVGKTPLEVVDGVTFLDHPSVREAFDRSGAPAETLALARDGDAVAIPIMDIGGRLLSRGAASASAGDVNWSLLISGDGQRAAVCYSTGATPEMPEADWYLDGEKAFTRQEACPSDADDLAGFGTWPIGGMPG